MEIQDDDDDNDDEKSVIGSVIESVVSGLASNTVLQPNVCCMHIYPLCLFLKFIGFSVLIYLCYVVCAG